MPAMKKMLQDLRESPGLAIALGFFALAFVLKAVGLVLIILGIK